MSDAMIRGHVLAHTATFIRTQLDESSNRRVEGELSIDARQAIDDVSLADWYPRRFLVELLDGLAAVKGRGDATYADMLRCGAAMTAVENEFMKLLLKVLTPELFIRKLPNFWVRDHRTSGALEVVRLDAAGRNAQLRLQPVAGYHHGAILWLGFIERVLARVGATSVDVAQRGWSWSTPGPSEVLYEVKWS